MIDIVIPNGNEDEFIEMAAKLGYSELCFLYDISNSDKIRKVDGGRIKIDYGVICKPDDVKKAKARFDLAACEATGNNRELFEKTKTDLVFNLENSEKKDFIYNRNSGLDQVSCKAANKNNVAVAFLVSRIVNSSNKPQLLGRIMQNIRFCKKYKVKMIIASFAREPFEMRAPNDLTGMFTVLGMNPKEAKKALNEAASIIGSNKNKKDKNYISEGVRVIG